MSAMTSFPAHTITGMFLGEMEDFGRVATWAWKWIEMYKSLGASKRDAVLYKITNILKGMVHVFPTRTALIPRAIKVDRMWQTHPTIPHIPNFAIGGL